MTTNMQFDSVNYVLYTEGERFEELKNYLLENWMHLNRDFLIYSMNQDFLRGYFEDIYNEWNMSYAEDIKSEKASDEKFENRLEEEMDEAGCDCVEDFVNELTESQLNEGNNGLDHYISNFGGNEVFDILKDVIETLIDFEELTEQVANIDGYGHFLNHYDGGEIEVEFDGEWYFAYREC